MRSNFSHFQSTLFLIPDNLSLHCLIAFIFSNCLLGYQLLQPCNSLSIHCSLLLPTLFYRINSNVLISFILSKLFYLQENGLNLLLCIHFLRFDLALKLVNFIEYPLLLLFFTIQLLRQLILQLFSLFSLALQSIFSHF